MGKLKNTMKLYVPKPNSDKAAAIRIAAAFENVQFELVNKAKIEGCPAVVLETAEGDVSSTNAVVKYVSALGAGKLLGASNIAKAQVDQWLAWRETTIAPTWKVVSAGVFGCPGIQAADYNEQAKNLKAHMKILNTALEGRKWLVGDSVTLADIVLATALQGAFQTVLDAGFRKAMKNVEPWVSSVYALPEYVAVQGSVQLCAKPLKPTGLIEAPKAPKKQAVQQPKAEKKEVVKPKDNIESLPPTPFNVYDFKTFYVNHADKAGAAVDEWYKMLDWDGWAFWCFHYEKYGKEGQVLHVTNNLVTGFLNRAEHTTKYTFARHCVLGEEPNLEIMGIWLCRGPTELPDGLAKEHPQVEYYKTRRMDPRNVPADDQLVREFFAGQEGDKLNGLTAQTLRWHK